MGSTAISGLLVLGGAFIIFGIAWWILQVIANWRIFTKAGEAGWKSIIPIYGDYISYKIAWRPSFFWINFILGVAVSGMNNYTDTPSSLYTAILVVLYILLIIIDFIYSLKLAKAFGKGTGFAIGLFFLKPIFLLILGFGSAEYVGADQ